LKTRTVLGTCLLIPELGGKRQDDHEFQASLGHISSSRSARDDKKTKDSRKKSPGSGCPGAAGMLLPVRGGT
jgi:hypothetical protein